MNQAIVKLRPLSIEDVDNVMTWVNDNEVIKNIANFDHVFSREEERKFLEKLTKSENDRVYSVENEKGEYIGQVGVNQIYWPARVGRLAMTIGNKEYQGKGYGQAALRELLRISFEELKMHKLWGVVFKTNERMRHILHKNGFELEGTLREEYILRGEYHDVVRMSILEKEYFKLKERKK